METNYENYGVYTVDGLTFKINLQNGAIMNYHPCPFCGQNTLHFVGMNDMLLSCPPQYKIDIACYNPRCLGHHNLSGIIINGDFNTDSYLAMTSTIKKLIESRPLEKIVSSKDSMVKEPEFMVKREQKEIPKNNFEFRYK